MYVGIACHTTAEITSNTNMLKIVISLACLGFGIDAHWNYGNSSHGGLGHWGGVCDNGTRQSPIDIPHDENQSYDSSLTSFNLTSYVSLGLSGLIIENNGHSAQVDIVAGSSISGGGLDGSYIPVQLHFHWGPDDHSGSEHTFRGHQYPLEMHIVHYKEQYGNISAAMDEDDGLAVLGVFFMLDDHHSYSEQTDKMAPIVDALGRILDKNENTTIFTTNVMVNDLLPMQTSEYYRYSGSLTTPSCNEIVIWTVFDGTSYVTTAQMEKFRTLHKSYKDADTIVPLNRNFRPIQTLGTRHVSKSYEAAVPPSFNWGYHGHEGPASWPQYYSTCNGDSQSPVDIPADEEVFYDEHLWSLGFHNYDETINGTIKNNGHTIQIDIDNTNISINGGNLSGPYRAAQFHFHWGKANAVGSEHLRNGKAFPLELHIVHYKESYGDFAAALGHDDGLAVVGYFFSVEDVNNTKYDGVISKLHDVKYKAGSSSITGISLKDLTGTASDSSHFFRYQGGLTTPPCLQIVTWSVMMEVINIGKDQLAEFHKLLHVEQSDSMHIGEEDYIGQNYRPTQPLGTRKVYSTYKFEISGATHIQQGLVTIGAISLCFIVSLL